MNTRLPIRAKLTTAALALVLVLGFSVLYDITTRSSGEIAFRVGCVVLGVIQAFGGVFGNARLQLFWGWGLAIIVPFLAALCVFVFRGSSLFWGSLTMLVAAFGAYLLLLDTSVKDYREGLRKKHVA